MTIELNPITSGYSTGLINDNFQAIEDYVNDKLLQRDGVETGEVNQMEVDLDMNSHFVYNLPEPVLEHQAARLQDVQNALSGGSANLITFTPYGSISSENVQAAIQEVSDEISANSSISTSTGTQSVEEAVEDRVFYISSLADLLEIDLSSITPGQLKWIGGNELTIYVDASAGDDLNDGFESEAPKATLQSAIDRLEVFGPYLNGQFSIELAAGTYARGHFPEDGLPSENPIIIRGPDVGGHPNVPTAIISEGADAAVELIKFRNGTNLRLKDIKFVGAEGTTSSAGAMGGDQCRLFTENVHAEDCYWGVGVTNRSNLDVKGGIFTRCGNLLGSPSSGAGTRTLFLSRHALGTQNAGTLALGPEFHNCVKACFAQEGSTGHADYLTIHDCLRGLEANINSRFNYTGTQFRRNFVDVFNNNSYVFASSVDYGTGADESNLRVVANNYGATGVVNYFTDHDPGNGIGARTYHSEYVDTLYNTASNNVFHTTTLAGGMWRNETLSPTTSRSIKFRVVGNCSGTTGTKRINMRMGTALAQVNFSAGSEGGFVVDGEIYFPDRAEQFLMLKGDIDGSSPEIHNVTSTQGLTANTPITLEANPLDAASGDNIRIYMVEATLFG